MYDGLSKSQDIFYLDRRSDVSLNFVQLLKTAFEFPENFNNAGKKLANLVLPYYINFPVPK